MNITDAIKRARETSQGYIGSRFGAPAESDSESIYIATTRNAWKAAVDVIEAAEVFLNDFLHHKTCTPGSLQRALTAFAEAMGEKA